jgi:hypothetical protein
MVELIRTKFKILGIFDIKTQSFWFTIRLRQMRV